MKTVRTLLAAGLLCLGLPVLIVYAAGMFPNLPLVGGASYCGGFSTGVSGQVCTVTVPAGPTAITGLEVVPADTNLAQGAAPQTVGIPIGKFGVGVTTYVDGALAAGSSTITSTTRRLILIPAADIATYTVVFPAATALTAADNQSFSLCSTQTVTTLTATAGAGTTLSPQVPTAITESAVGAYCYEWVYRLSNTTWYRVQ